MKKTFYVLLLSILSFYSTNAQRSFDTKVDYQTGLSPTNIAVGDFNGDGSADFVVTNSFSNTISVFTGTGTGSFGEKKDYNTGQFPSGIVIGDFNSDGNSDLAVANVFDPKISVFTGTGSGTFGIKTDYNLTSTPIPASLITSDFNGDGKSDLVVSDETHNTIAIFTGTGFGTFGSKVNYGSSVFFQNSALVASTMSVADFNNDGKHDVAVSNYGNSTISIFMGKGDGGFETEVYYGTEGTPLGLIANDFNGDGNSDLAVAVSDDQTLIYTVWVFTGTGTGSFGTKVGFDAGWPFGLAAGDFNGDGKSDLAVTNQEDNSIIILTGTGTGSFGTKIDYQMGAGFGYNIAASDFNGDGKSDLAFVNSGGNNGKGSIGWVSILLAKDAQQISDFSATTKIGNTFTFNATSTSGLPVSYISSNPSILSISGNSATATGVGQVTVTAIQSGNTSWFGVTTTGIITVLNKASQTITLGNFGYVTYGMYMPIPVTVSSGLPASFSVNGPAVLIGNTISFTGVGNVTVTANQVGNSDYLPAISQSVSFYVYQAFQNFTFVGLPSTLYYDTPPFSFSAIFSSGLPANITFTGPVVLNNGIGKVTGTGSLTITAFQGGNTYYRPTTIVRSYQIFKANQTLTLTLTQTPSCFFCNPPTFSFIATITSGLPITYTTSAPTQYSFNQTSGYYDIIKNGVHGTVLVTASQDGNANYNPAISVTKAFYGVFRIGIEDGSKEQVSGITLFPNPASKTINLISDADIIEVLVYNSQGQLVLNSLPLEEKIDISTLPLGVYAFKISSSKEVVIKKVVIE